jgi:hypothetical protein
MDFAKRAKQVENAAVVNEDHTATQLQARIDELERINEMMKLQKQSGNQVEAIDTELHLELAAAKKTVEDLQRRVSTLVEQRDEARSREQEAIERESETIELHSGCALEQTEALEEAAKKLEMSDKNNTRRNQAARQAVDRIKSLQAENQSLKNQAQKVINQVRKEREAAVRATTELQTKNGELQRAFGPMVALQAKLDACQCGQLQAEIQALTEKLATSERQSADLALDLQNTKGSLNEQVAQLPDQLQELRNERDVLAEESTAMLKKNQEMCVELNALETHLRNWEEASSRTLVYAEAVDYQSVDGDNSEAKPASPEDLRTCLGRLEADAAKRTRREQDLLADVQRLTENDKSSTAIRSGLNKQMQDCANKIEDLQRELEEQSLVHKAELESQRKDMEATNQHMAASLRAQLAESMSFAQRLLENQDNAEPSGSEMQAIHSAPLGRTLSRGRSKNELYRAGQAQASVRLATQLKLLEDAQETLRSKDAEIIQLRQQIQGSSAGATVMAEFLCDDDSPPSGTHIINAMALHSLEELLTVDAFAEVQSTLVKACKLSGDGDKDAAFLMYQRGCEAAVTILQKVLEFANPLPAGYSGYPLLQQTVERAEEIFLRIGITPSTLQQRCDDIISRLLALEHSLAAHPTPTGQSPAANVELSVRIQNLELEVEKLNGIISKLQKTVGHEGRLTVLISSLQEALVYKGQLTASEVEIVKTVEHTCQEPDCDKYRLMLNTARELYSHKVTDLQETLDELNSERCAMATANSTAVTQMNAMKRQYAVMLDLFALTLTAPEGEAGSSEAANVAMRAEWKKQLETLREQYEKIREEESQTLKVELSNVTTVIQARLDAYFSCTPYSELERAVHAKGGWYGGVFVALDRLEAEEAHKAAAAADVKAFGAKLERELRELEKHVVSTALHFQSACSTTQELLSACGVESSVGGLGLSSMGDLLVQQAMETGAFPRPLPSAPTLDTLDAQGLNMQDKQAK